MHAPTTRGQWRALWISDVHLGSKHSQTEALLEFLRRHRAESLYLVGDFIDGWELRRAWRWDDRTNTVIQKVLKKSRKGTRVTYITGNHDEFLESYAGFRFGGLRVVRDAIHVTADGRRLLVIHGHQFDGLTSFNRVLERLGSRLYELVLECNLHFNRVRRRLGLGYWSFSAYLKDRTKKAVQYVTEFETALARLAEARGVDGVICGHIHRATISHIGGLEYLNCGDWVESCTALAEDVNGHIHLLHYHETSVHGPGRRPGAHDPGYRRVGDPVATGA